MHGLYKHDCWHYVKCVHTTPYYSISSRFYWPCNVTAQQVHNYQWSIMLSYHIMHTLISSLSVYISWEQVREKWKECQDPARIWTQDLEFRRPWVQISAGSWDFFFCFYFTSLSLVPNNCLTRPTVIIIYISCCHMIEKEVYVAEMVLETTFNYILLLFLGQSF